MTLVTHQTGPEGKKVGRVLIEEGLQIDRELYLSIVIDRASASPVVIASAAGGMDIEEVAATHPEQILREAIDAGRRRRAVPGAQAGVRHGARRRRGEQVRESAGVDLHGVRRDRRVDDRDQPAHRDQGRRPAGARRQGELRRQRALPPPGPEGSARPQRGGPARGRGVEVLAQLHPPGRHHRLHGQRRGPGHGHDGHHQARRGRAGQLPRRRRRRQRRADSQRVQDPDDRRQREGGAHQHLRRHPALRRAGGGRRGRGQGAERQRADRRAHGRDQRRGRQAHPARERPEVQHGGFDGRGGGEDRGAGAAQGKGVAR